jgi:hypothetical protein
MPGKQLCDGVHLWLHQVDLGSLLIFRFGVRAD